MSVYVYLLIGYVLYRPANWLSHQIVDPIFDRYWPAPTQEKKS